MAESDNDPVRVSVHDGTGVGDSETVNDFVSDTDQDGVADRVWTSDMVGEREVLAVPLRLKVWVVERVVVGDAVWVWVTVAVAVWGIDSVEVQEWLEVVVQEKEAVRVDGVALAVTVAERLWLTEGVRMGLHEVVAVRVGV